MGWNMLNSDLYLFYIVIFCNLRTLIGNNLTIMRRLLQYFLSALFIVGLSLSIASCDKDDEPKLSAKHSMIIGKWNHVKSTTKWFYRIPETGEEIPEGEQVLNINGDTWEFSNGLVTIKEEPIQDPSIGVDYTIPDIIWEYRYEEDRNELWTHRTIWKIVKLTPNEMIIHAEGKYKYSNLWASLTNEFVRP